MLESRSNEQNRVAQPGLLTESGGLQTLMRYAFAVWDRIAIVLLCLAVFCSAGLAYFLMSPRVYESQAEIMIRSVSRDDRMLMSDPVLEDAAIRLSQDHTVDFSGIPVDERAEYLRGTITVRKPGGQPDIIQVRCRSNKPEETVAILEAVVSSYRAYMGFVDHVEATGNPLDPGRFASRMLELLLAKKSQIEKRMAEARAELFDQMRKLDEEFDPEKTGVRPVRGSKHASGLPERAHKTAAEPGRFVPPNETEKIDRPTPQGKNPEQVLRLQMLAYENRLLGMMRSLIDDLAENADDAKRKKAKAEVIQKPALPTDPISPRKLSHILFAAFVFGTALGLAIVFLLDALDDRFRSRAELNDLLAAPVIGTVTHPAARHQGAVARTTNLPSGDFERTQHCFPVALAINSLRPSNPILVLTRVNTDVDGCRVADELAETYRLTGSRVLVIEAGGKQTADDSAPESGLSRVLTSPRAVTDALTEFVQSGVSDSGQPDRLDGGQNGELSPALLSSNRLAELLEVLADRYDRVIVDTPAVRSAATAAIIGRLAGGALLVVNPQADSRAETKMAAEALLLHGCPVWGIAIDAHGLPRSWSRSESGSSNGIPLPQLSGELPAIHSQPIDETPIAHRMEQAFPMPPSDDDDQASTRQAA